MVLAPEASQKTISTSYFHADVDAESKAWMDRYVEMYKTANQAPRPSQAAWGYRATKLIAVPCLRQVGEDREKIRECLKAWHGMVFGLPAHEARFDATNQLVISPDFTEVVGKEFKLLAGVND
jgi:ABC-type branched-subunit amino acid transport system substrate-binding protein